jgi:hypothetical protein
MPIVPPVPETIPAAAEGNVRRRGRSAVEAVTAPLRDKEEVSLRPQPQEAEQVPPEPVAAEAPPPPPEIPAPAPEITPEPVFAASPQEEQVAPELLEAINAPIEEPAVAAEEPVAQGEPIPQLTTALSAEPVISELAQPEPESPLGIARTGGRNRRSDCRSSTGTVFD